MTTSINIDSLKSSLIEKTEKYNALTLVLAKKETENRLLPSSITKKNTVCDDLLKIISEETSEFEKLSSSINEKIAKRNFLAQQLTEQESIDTPHSIQVLINQLDNEILTDKIYGDTLHQSIFVQTSTYDALIEAVTLETTEYDNLTPVISLLKDKTELLAIELASETGEYEILSAKTNILNDEKNTTVTVDHDLDTYLISTTEHYNEQDIQDPPVPTESSNNEELEPKIIAHPDKNIDSIYVNSAEETDSTISAEKVTEHDTANNESSEYESNIAKDNSDNGEFDANDLNLDNYSLNPVELTNKLYASTIASPESNALENESDQKEAVLNDNQTTEFSADKKETINVDSEQFDFAIDVIKLRNEQDFTSLDSSEINSPEEEFKRDDQNDEDAIKQIKNFGHNDLAVDINVDKEISHDSVTVDTEQYDFEIEQVELTNAQDSTSSELSEKEMSEDEFDHQNFSESELPTDIDGNTAINPDSFTEVTKQHDVETDSVEHMNEQNSTASELSETEGSEGGYKFDFQNFEDELEQLKNFSDNVVTENNHNAVTVDTEQHDLEIAPVGLKQEQVSASETEPPEDEDKRNQQDFQDELEQIQSFSHHELQSEIVSDNDEDSKTTATIDTEQDVFSIDSTNLVHEQESSDLKAALASAELDAIENKFTSKSDFEEELSLNNRTTTRFVRSDIKTKLIVYKLLGASKPFEVELLDVSSKGALIKSSKKLRKNARVTLKFNFQLDARRFAIAGKIVRKTTESAYGIKFSNYQDEFADHLLNTQTHLVFK